MRFSRNKIINYIAIILLVGAAYIFNDGQLPIGDQSQRGQNSDSSRGSSGDSGSKRTATGDFDHYVMALSWSPTFCAENADRNREQCGANRNYAFVVHGLWPQHDRGGWPDFCGGDRPGRVPDNIVDDIIDIMPSRGLIGHQWKKHGTCAGLDVDGYFGTVREAYQRITIPEQFRNIDSRINTSPEAVREAFASANPGLDSSAIGVTCDNRLREVRICMTKSLEFRNCANSGKQCRSDSIVMLPTRG